MGSSSKLSLCLRVFMVLPKGTQDGAPTFDGHLQILPTPISCMVKQVKLHLNYPLRQALASLPLLHMDEFHNAVMCF